MLHGLKGAVSTEASTWRKGVIPGWFMIERGADDNDYSGLGYGSMATLLSHTLPRRTVAASIVRGIRSLTTHSVAPASGASSSRASRQVSIYRFHPVRLPRAYSGAHSGPVSYTTRRWLQIFRFRWHNWLHLFPFRIGRFRPRLHCVHRRFHDILLLPDRFLRECVS